MDLSSSHDGGSGLGGKKTPRGIYDTNSFRLGGADDARVGEAIEKLKPQTGSIFVMHRFDGLSYEEIATAKGISVKGVEWHIAQAMIAIRKARADTK